MKQLDPSKRQEPVPQQPGQESAKRAVASTEPPDADPAAAGLELPEPAPDTPLSGWAAAFDAVVNAAAEAPQDAFEESEPAGTPDTASGAAGPEPPEARNVYGAPGTMSFERNASAAIETADSAAEAEADDSAWDEPARARRIRVPEWVILALVGAVIAVVLFLAVDFYAGGSLAGAAATATLKTPSATPVLAEDGTPQYLDAYFLPVGDGNCSLLRAPGGETLLVDTGSAAFYPIVDALLQELGVSSIDLLILTVPDEMHMGGAAQLVTDYAVGECRMTAAAHEDALLAPVCAALESKSIPVTETIASYISVVPWAENVELRILSPHDVDYQDAPDDSIMLRVKFGASAVLLASDAEALAERMAVKALPNRDFHADVLLAGSHGAVESTSEKFLSAVNPSVAVISCGLDSRVSPAVLARLEARGAAVYRTDELGLIHIALDGAAAQVVE